MDTAKLRKQAQEQAKNFLENESEYRMGYIEAELPHPLTRKLSQTYAESTEKGVAMLLSVDAEMAGRAKELLLSDGYTQFADAVRNTLKNGGRVIWSGCGSSGRLCMRLENSWRHAMDKLALLHPEKAGYFEEMKGRVGSIMTGGDYAIIRAVECFEDSTNLGYKQAEGWQLTEKDLLVGVTATGETTSILGSAQGALDAGAKVYMLICSNPVPLIQNMERVRKVYTNPNCSYLFLPCGPMALTGSTRMQSSSFEQLAGAIALEDAIYDLMKAYGYAAAPTDHAWHGKAYADLIDQLSSKKSVSAIADMTRLEESVYRAGSVLTMYAEEYMLDVMTDTTERPPTFMTPPFTSLDMLDQPMSWAFVKNPSCETRDAWQRCFARPLRCIDWDGDQYRALGLSQMQIDRIPRIDDQALVRFCIGCEPLPERENKPGSLAMWVGKDAAPESFHTHAARYGQKTEYTLDNAGLNIPETWMDIYEHLGMKIYLNTLSTGVMASMGRIDGNWMTCLAMSNKKLIDRSARIVADVCSIPYEQALEECFYSSALIEAQNGQTPLSPAQEAIRRLS